MFSALAITANIEIYATLNCKVNNYLTLIVSKIKNV